MRNNEEKLKIFGKMFTGLTNIYGTYDPRTGRSRQIKSPVTNHVFYDHLMGKTPYGIYLLNGNKTRAVVIDFDLENRLLPIEFVNSAKHYKISGYIERSKSKGYHVWIFFPAEGVPAKKARLVAKHILDEIDATETEIFPKQDELSNNLKYGNFINAPLFGPLVKKGRTVFLNPVTFEPEDDQWSFLDSVDFVSEQTLSDIIEINEWVNESPLPPAKTNHISTVSKSYGLPICAQRILQEGVIQNQRVLCFRLAVHCKLLGFTQDITIAILTAWSQKNRPRPPKQIITTQEINKQISDVYKNNYKSYGCETEEIRPFCSPDCPVYKFKIKDKI